MSENTSSDQLLSRVTYQSVQAQDLSVDHWLHFRHHFPKIIFPVFIARRDEKIVTKKRKEKYIYLLICDRRDTLKASHL